MAVRRSMLVYNQSWEDPGPDLAALRAAPGRRLLTTTGCYHAAVVLERR